MAPEPQPIQASRASVDGDSLLRPDDAAFLLSSSKAFVYAAAESGAIRHVKVGRLLRFRRSDIEQYIASRSQGGEP